MPVHVAPSRAQNWRAWVSKLYAISKAEWRLGKRPVIKRRSSRRTNFKTVEVFDLESSEAQQLSTVPRDERQHPGQRGHVEPLESRPLPAVRFAAHHDDGAHALQR